ncbi:hypothetical protein ACROYT_G002192 [Oculina patagonica]
MMQWTLAAVLIISVLAHSVVGDEPSVTCGDYEMLVSFEKSAFSSLDASRLHLQYPFCPASENFTHIYLTTSLNDCGTTFVETGDTLVFSNKVIQDALAIQGSGDDGSTLITREHDFELAFHCSYSRKKLLSLYFVPEGRVDVPGVGGFGNFTFRFNVYRSSAYSTPYNDNEFPVEMTLNDYMYFEYSVDSSADLVIMAENCRATKNPDFYSSPHYTIIENGCARDTSLIHDYDTSRNYQRFQFLGFRFFNNYDTFYLHCELLACHQNSNSRCQQGCLSGNRRKRREVEEEYTSSDVVVITRGPLVIKEKKEAAGTSKQSAAVIGGAAAAGGFALVAVIALAVLFVKYRIARLLLNKNKVGDLYATQDEQMSRSNAYIKEEDMVEKSDAM